MRMNIRMRYEMIMSQVEVEVLMMICNPEEYAYGYRYISEDEWLVETEDESLLEEMADELHRYICNIDVDFELDERVINTDEWERYEIAKEIWNEINEMNNY
jgi:hypothetical protein